MRSQLMEPEGWRYVLVYLFDRDEGAKNLVRQVIEDAGGKVVFQSPRGFYLAANVPQDQLAVVARCDAVCAIERRYGAFELRAPGKSGESLPPLAKGLITLSQIRELCGAEAEPTDDRNALALAALRLPADAHDAIGACLARGPFLADALGYGSQTVGAAFTDAGGIDDAAAIDRAASVS